MPLFTSCQCGQVLTMKTGHRLSGPFTVLRIIVLCYAYSFLDNFMRQYGSLTLEIYEMGHN